MRARTVLTEAGAVLAGTRRRLVGVPLPSAAATLTYYGGVAVVPWLLLALWTTTWTSTRAAARDRLMHLQVLVPPDLGGRGPWRQLVDAATGLHLLVAAVLVFGASFYGEGVRRACLVLVPSPDRWTGWRGRLVVLPLLAPLPLLTAALLAVGDRLAPLAPGDGGGGAGDLVLRVLLGFTALWLALTLPIAWLVRCAAPPGVGWPAALLGGTLTAASLAGFLHGFQLFLSIPLDVGAPFAGLGVVGGSLAVAFWLYLLHVVLLVGWVFTRELDDRLRRPPGPVTGGAR